MDTQGHLFVVHGRIHALVHDAAIIPTDSVGTLESHWQDMVDAQLVRQTPLHHGWAAVQGGVLWLMDAAADDYSDVLDALEGALQDVAGTVGAARFREGLPRLVAVPVLGIGAGGYHDDRGTVLKDLIIRLTEIARTLCLDIALVTPEVSVYSAAQYVRRRYLDTPLPEPLEERASDLGAKARAGELALFLGAGVSIPAGLISWTKLIEELAGEVKDVSVEDLEHLSPTDQAELIQKAQPLTESKTPQDFQQRVADRVRKAETPSLIHGLIAGLDVNQVVTTNYDDLFERAVAAADRDAGVVLPRDSAVGKQRWVLKLHGDAKDPATIVLTRRHMVLFDSANRPSGALLQSLFLTKHVLVLGASLTDDNVIRLAHEVDAYKSVHRKDLEFDAFGTVLDVSPHDNTARGRLWDRQLEWVQLSTKDDRKSGPRHLELLLDRMGMYSTRDSSWLLDARFEGMLSESDRLLAQRARDLAKSLPPRRRDDTWGPLRERLQDLGAIRP